MMMIGLARLGRDAELRKTANGDSMTNLALAFNYGKKNGDKFPTQWIDGTLWGKRADALMPYLVKGQQFLVQLDDPHTEEYDRKDGTKGFSLRAFVGKIEFAGPKPDAKRAEPKPEPKKQYDGRGGFDDMDDDIPF